MRHDVDEGAFARAVAAVQQGNPVEFHRPQPLFREDLEGIKGMETGSLLAHDNIGFSILAGQSQFSRVDHGLTASLGI